MRIFVQASDKRVWKIIEKGPRVPTKKEEDKQIPKPENEWTDEDNQMNSWIIKLLTSSIVL